MPTPCYISITGQTQGNITAGAFTADSVGNIYVQGHEDEMLVQEFLHNVTVPTDPQSGQPAGQRVLAGALDREHVFPAVGMEQAGDQRRAQDIADLLAAHAGLQGLDLFARDEIALDDIGLVGPDEVGKAGPGAAEASATGQGGRAGTDQEDQAQAGAAWGFDGHG